MPNTSGAQTPRRNVGQRELGDAGKAGIGVLSASRFGQNLDGDPSTLSHI